MYVDLGSPSVAQETSGEMALNVTVADFCTRSYQRIQNIDMGGVKYPVNTVPANFSAMRYFNEPRYLLRDKNNGKRKEIGARESNMILQDSNVGVPYMEI